MRMPVLEKLVFFLVIYFSTIIYDQYVLLLSRSKLCGYPANSKMLKW